MSNETGCSQFFLKYPVLSFLIYTPSVFGYQIKQFSYLIILSLFSVWISVETLFLVFGLLLLSVLTPLFVFNILLLNVGYRMKLLVFDTLLLGVWISDERLLVFDVLLPWISDESLHVFLTSDETLLLKMKYI